MADHPGAGTPTPEAVIIIRGGLAALSVTRELRLRGFQGAITIVDREGYPYDRPPLSKAYLESHAAGRSLELVDRDWYRENKVDVVLGEVESLDADTSTVTLTDGRSLTGDRLVLATGGLPRPLPVSGRLPPGILYLRSRADADRIRPHLGTGRRLVIVGAGLIGAELASTAVAQGTEVVLVDSVATPLALAVGEAAATRLQDMHAGAGVTCILGAVTALARTPEGWVTTIEHEARSEPLDTHSDAVVVAIGILPDTAVAEAAGIHVDNGVLVDELQQTSRPHILAVGDVARRRNPDGSLERAQEHWEAAVFDGRRAAATILGIDPVPVNAPWFWSDRYGVHVEVVGSMTAPGETVIRDSGDGSWAAFRVNDETLVGCVAIDAAKIVRAARRLIDTSTAVTTADLVTASDLRQLLR